MQILRSGLFFICGLIIASSAWIEIHAQDKIHRRSGRPLEGEILEETESYVKIKLKYGEMKVKRTDITKIERGVGGAEEAYLALLDKTDKDDPEAVAELARWCKDHDRFKEARKHWDQVLDLDPDHEDARTARGFVRAKDGKWVRSEDVAKRGREEKEREKISKRLKGSAEEFEGVPWADAYEVPSAHYLLTCNVTRPVAERYSKFIESAYAGYLEFFRKIHTPSPEKSNVYIFRNYEEYLTMAGRPGVAGFYTPKGSGSIAARSVTAYHGGFGTTGGTDEVLLHELTHQFEHLVIGDEFWNAPIWLIEGLAVFFEACEIKGGKAIYKLPGSKTIGIVPRERLILLKAQIKAGNYDKLKKLIRTPQARFGYSQYTAAWSVIHWMWNADGGKYKSIFYTLWKTSRQKRIEPEFVEKLILDATGKDIEEFEEKIWKPYVVKLEALPPGIIKGNKFVSRRMKLEISRPKGAWKWDMKDLPAELQVRLRNETADVTIEVSAIMTRRSGDELKEKGVDGIIDEAIEEIKTRVDNDLYDPADPDNTPPIAYKELNLRGFRAGRFEYDIKTSFQSFEDDDEESTTRFLVVIPTVKRYFEFRCECPKEKAKQVRIAFDELVRSVRIAK